MTHEIAQNTKRGATAWQHPNANSMCIRPVLEHHPGRQQARLERHCEDGFRDSDDLTQSMRGKEEEHAGSTGVENTKSESIAEVNFDIPAAEPALSWGNTSTLAINSAYF
ncbi:hypothetical protein CAPTEDRAFT_197965 [Capitella teleta]|uniref:Uncharacterized protein n=1 Tax=Capitella teleta TaxID=283909 RepID=R7UI76_CAPTE|nr:hypothetical protein CAPTEDRAFT_197965 [Capitella teleta]|eukprot:ELU02942.1 hypothetical protein CAPTEDRAFT_197965 [Capitella teleta]